MKAVHAKYSQLLELYKGALDNRRAEMKGSCPDIYRLVCVVVRIRTYWNIGIQDVFS